jgi:SPP1 family predicted phage head-tail adaptor
MRLERLDRYGNDFIESAGGWVDVCNLWAGMKTMRAEQRVQNKLAELTITHTIMTRWDERVPLTNDKLRMIDLTNEGRQYNVRTWIDVDEKHERIEWECVEVRE